MDIELFDYITCNPEILPGLTNKERDLFRGEYAKSHDTPLQLQEKFEIDEDGKLMFIAIERVWVDGDENGAESPCGYFKDTEIKRIHDKFTGEITFTYEIHTTEGTKTYAFKSLFVGGILENVSTI